MEVSLIIQSVPTHFDLYLDLYIAHRFRESAAVMERILTARPDDILRLPHPLRLPCGLLLCHAETVLLQTFGLAFLVSVTLEASFLNLEKLVFSSKSKSKPTNIKRFCSFRYTVM